MIKVKIETLAFGGAGIGRFSHEGRSMTVFISDTVPGDIVEAFLTKIKPSYWEARVARYITYSSDRIKPRCKHFGVCGGCTWQFLSYENQLKFKEEQVRESLEHIGRIENPQVEKIIGCEDPWYYRNKMELSFGEYTLVGHPRENGDPERKVTPFQAMLDSRVRGDDRTCGSSPVLGFHLRGMRYEIFDLEECFLQSTFLPSFIKGLRLFVNEQGWKAYNSKLKTGFLKSLFIREGKNTGEIMVNLVTQGEAFDVDKAHVFRDFVERNFSEITALYYTEIIDRKGRKTVFCEHHLSGRKTLTEILNLYDGSSLTFEIAPQAFFQPNTFQAQSLYSKVLEFADLGENDVVFDLFCGTGTIGLFCAKKCRSVLGVELNEEAIKSARQNASLNDISNIEFFVGDVAHALKTYKEKPSVIVVDPPRAGLGEKLVHQIVQFQPKKVVSVSCNPTTFARDAMVFESLGYRLKSVVPVDMFPQTYHIETVSLFIY